MRCHFRSDILGTKKAALPICFAVSRMSRAAIEWCLNRIFRSSLNASSCGSAHSAHQIKADSEKRGSWVSGRRAMPERHRRDWLRLSVEFGIEPCNGLTELILVLHADRDGFTSVQHPFRNGGRRRFLQFHAKTPWYGAGCSLPPLGPKRSYPF